MSNCRHQMHPYLHHLRCCAIVLSTVTDRSVELEINSSFLRLPIEARWGRLKATRSINQFIDRLIGTAITEWNTDRIIAFYFPSATHFARDASRTLFADFALALVTRGPSCAHQALWLDSKTQQHCKLQALLACRQYGCDFIVQLSACLMYSQCTTMKSIHN